MWDAFWVSCARSGGQSLALVGRSLRLGDPEVDHQRLPGRMTLVSVAHRKGFGGAAKQGAYRGVTLTLN